MVKIQCFNKVYYVAIPKTKMTAKNWKVGDELDVNFNAEGNLVYSKLRNHIKE